LNLERKLREMQDRITDAELGQEVAEEQAAFWEKKAKELELEAKQNMYRLSRLASVEQELETYKSKVGDLAK
jgi:hypothetical protein